MNVLNLNDRFNDYLEKVKLDKKKMSALQLQDMERSFFAGASVMFDILAVIVPEIPDEDVCIDAISYSKHQLLKFWNETVHKHKAKYN